MNKRKDNAKIIQLNGYLKPGKGPMDASCNKLYKEASVTSDNIYYFSTKDVNGHNNKNETIHCCVYFGEKFEKVYKNKDLNIKNYEAFDEGRVLSIEDSHKDWANYNSHVFVGLDPSKDIAPGIGGENRTTKIMRVISGPTGKKAIIKAPLDWRELGLMRDKKNEHYQKDLKKYKQKKKNWVKKKEYAEKHGLDFNEQAPEKPKIFALKKLSDTSGFLIPNFRTTHREVAFNYLADHVFGLGDYVAKTALFNHPKTKIPWSAQEFIEGQDVSPDLSNIKHYKNSGILEKLAVMDIVLGNSDRNIKNMKLDNNNQLKLIDNAASFDYTGIFNHAYPAYIIDHLEKAPSLDFHKWLDSIKISNFKDHLNKIKCPKPLLNVALKRLKIIQEWSQTVRNNPDFSQDLAGALDQARIEKIGDNKMITCTIKQNILNRIRAGQKYIKSEKTNPTDKTKKIG